MAKRDALNLEYGIETLKIFQKYGVLSTSTLYKILGEYKSDRYLRRITRLLTQQGFLVDGTAHIKGNPSPYYYLSTTRKARKVLSLLLEVPEEDVGSAYTRYKQFDHEDILSQIQFEIESKFKGVITVRDWQLAKSVVPDLVFPRTLSEEDFYPDLIIGLPPSSQEPHSNLMDYKWVAIELERYRKKHERVKIKLTDYAERTGLDGVLYMLPNYSLEHKYQQYFLNQAAAHSLQLRGLENTFFATTHLPVDDMNVFAHHLNFSDRKLSIHNWFTFLQKTSRQDRAKEWKAYLHREVRV